MGSVNSYYLNWESDESHLFLNPYLPINEQERITQFFKHKDEKRHVFIATSGSSSLSPKLIALSKEAFLNSSRAVNREFEITSKDILLNILPTFHVGGLSLFSRAFCTQCRIVNVWDENYKWSPANFVKLCQDSQATVTSLVPTQIFDLVSQNFISPQALRCVFVGGGALSQELFIKAQQFGWRLYPTYGMTECCSQVATLPYRYQSLDWTVAFPLKVLSHLSVFLTQEERIVIFGNSLLSYEVHFQDKTAEIRNPKQDNYFYTQDLGCFEDGYLNVLGRIDDHIKIKGELVNLIKMNQLFQTHKEANRVVNDSAVIALNDDRLGYKLVCVFEALESTYQYQSLLDSFNSSRPSYEKISRYFCVEKLPRTALGKLQTKRLTESLISNANLKLT